MAEAAERHDTDERRATTTEDTPADARDDTRDDTGSDDEPANKVPAWLAEGMAFGGTDNNENHRGFLRTVFRTD